MIIFFSTNGLSIRIFSRGLYICINTQAQLNLLYHLVRGASLVATGPTLSMKIRNAQRAVSHCWFSTVFIAFDVLLTQSCFLWDGIITE